MEKLRANGTYQLLHKGLPIDNNISETVRIIDAKKAEYDYVLSRLGSKIEYVDLEAKNFFYEGVSSFKLKCITGFNHYRRRNKIINDELTKNECPRCSCTEDWHHVIQCLELRTEKRTFIIKLYNKLQKQITILE